jgi:hypothetical protein
MSARFSARLAWSLLALTVALVGFTVVLEALNHRLAGEDAASGYGVAVMAITFTGVGALVARRRPGNAIGWIFCAVGVLQAVNLCGAGYAQYAAVTRPGSLPAAELIAWVKEWCWIPSIALLTTFLLLLFPDGHLPSRRWRWVAWTTAAAIALTVALVAVSLWPTRAEIAVGVESGEVDVGLAFALGVSAAFAAIVFGAIASVVSVVLRFRRSTGAERQQLKWFAYAGAFMVASVASGFIPGGGAPEALFDLGVLAIPVATGMAILRYRLYDIDVVINRTLVYGALTATLAGCYLATVLLLQLALSPGSDLAVAGSTLAVAALFRPARGRIQAAVDRRFYRGKYDAQRTLDAFSAHVRDEIELDSLSAELCGVVRETMQPAHVSLWLRDPAVTISGRSWRRREPR